MSWLWRSISRLNIRGDNPPPNDAQQVAGADTKRMDVALSYRSPLTLREQHERLNVAGPYEWVERDSHWYPDYISTRCYPDYGFFKVFDQVDGRFNLTLKLVTRRDVVQEELARLLEVARVEVLSVVRATDIQEAEPND